MVKTYKNFLLIDREDSIPAAVTMARNLGAAFDDDRRVWHARSGLDKVILVYNQPLRADNTIRDYPTQASVDFQPGTCVGYIQLYCQGVNVKVNKFQFQDGTNQLEYWRMLKQYLVETIRSSGTRPSQTTFTLYWERRLMNNNMQQTAENVGLLSNRNNMTYVFQDSDLEVQNNWGSAFGNSFNSNWGNSWFTQ